MSPAHGNLGDWSELYALASLISARGAFGPPSNSVSPPHFFGVKEIFVRDTSSSQRYRYVLHDSEVLLQRSGQQDRNLDLRGIEHFLNEMRSDLLSKGATRHFSLASGKELMMLLGKQNVSASSNQRISDFELIIADPETGNPTPRIGYSVKSSIGSPATLLNASGATNFIYEVSDESRTDPRLILSGDSLKGHVKQLFQAGFAISFRGLQSETFKLNLMKVDSSMPDILSEVLLNSLRGSSSNFADISEVTFNSGDPLGQQRIFKLKQLLGSIAMGLRPTGAWDGDPTKFKGLIVVDQMGDLTFNYQFNQISFWDFLYSNVKFEIPSRSRHRFGRIYLKDGKYFLKLNLQIRFIK